jgi:DNA helicase-2/ATP-dependent DNA helicase PcrA
MPYQIIGGMKFYERAEIKDALSYLRILVNPKSDVDLLRIINSPARGIGNTTVERLTLLAAQEDVPIFTALDRLEAAGHIGAAAQKRLAGFRDLLKSLQKETTRSKPAELLDSVLSRTGYREALEAENTAESDARLENLAELAGSLHDYEAEVAAAGEQATIDGFLERVSLQADVDTMVEGGRVTLMTVHGAKGLEFELVLLTGMEEEMFPYRGMDPGGHEELEEERRLAYVAITRARSRLVITHAELRQIFGQTRWGRPSRFIGDIPKDAAAHLATRAAGIKVERYVDRRWDTPRTPGREWRPGREDKPWRHPQSVDREDVDPGERYVDRAFFADDHGAPESEIPLRRGTRVLHARFGEGEVRKVEASSEPTVIAFFPGWGEKKILARFLKLA